MSKENKNQSSSFGEEVIKWTYFFGGSSCRYYKSEINGNRVEKYTTRLGNRFSIGNIDEAKKKYKTQDELLEACFT
jgi:hypothetical protein